MSHATETETTRVNTCDVEIQDCRDRWLKFYQPTSELERWVFEQMVVNTVRMEHCQLQDRAVESLLAHRACLVWEDDRMLAVEEIAAGLARRPALVARRLSQSKYGVDWLIARFHELETSLKRGESLSETLTSHALDLLGVATNEREAYLDGSRGTFTTLIDDELDRLAELLINLEELDRRERELAELRIAVEIPKPVAANRKYEAACWKRVQWAMDELKGCRTMAPHFGKPEAAKAAHVEPERVAEKIPTAVPCTSLGARVETAPVAAGSQPATMARQAEPTVTRHMNRRKRRAIAKQAKG